MVDSHDLPMLTPRRLVLSYLVFGVLWIFVTDLTTAATFGGPPVLEQVQLLKGLLFVVGSAAFMFGALRRRDTQLAAERDSLRATRNRLKGIIEASPVPILAVDTDGEVTLWNEAAERTFGWTAEEVTGERPPLVPEEATGEYRRHLERALDGESLSGVETRRQTRDGERRHISLSTAPVLDGGGNVTEVMAVLLDITDRKRREQDLLRYERLMENLPVGIFQTDPERGRFTEANSTLVSMFDADGVEELYGRSIQDFYVDDAERMQVLDQFDADGTASVETRFHTLDGDVFWGRAIGLEHVDTEGNVFVDGILEDVTDIRERERQFEVLDRILRHNFRNVLGVILGHAEQLQDTVPETASGSVERISESAERLLELAEKERLIVKLVSGEIQAAPQDFGDVVDRQAATFRDRFPEATIEVDRPADCVVSAVPQVEDAVAELLENAAVHAGDGEPEVAVTVTVERGEAAVLARIADNGPGIPFGELAEFQLDRPIDQLTHGTGLDLWLVYWAVTASGGTIRFEENEPRGTVVTIELPRA